MVLDVCPPLPSPPEVIRLAVERTAPGPHAGPATTPVTTRRCSGSSRAARARRCAPRAAERTVALDFDGYGIGGLSVGETREEMVPALAAAIAHLPVDRPRYLMGVGDPASMVEAIDLGVDQFDCVMQTRLGRHGTALTSAGRLNVKRNEFALSDEPIDHTCPCWVCARTPRGYLRHLFKVGEPTASRLVSVHNVAWTIELMAACGLRSSRRWDAFRSVGARRVGMMPV
jgi:queuine tRNA-ribosyltransferase